MVWLASGVMVWGVSVCLKDFFSVLVLESGVGMVLCVWYGWFLMFVLV